MALRTIRKGCDRQTSIAALRCVWCFAVILVSATWVWSSTGMEAQERVSETFDAVSIKKNQNSASSRVIRQLPSGLIATKVTALDLIGLAFDMTAQDIVGVLPGWTKTTTFDVVAKSAGEPLTRSRLRRMLRTMLQDRFGLEASFERADGPVYALVMARADGTPGPNLHPSEWECVRDPVLREVGRMPVRTLTIDTCGAIPRDKQWRACLAPGWGDHDETARASTLAPRKFRSPGRR